MCDRALALEPAHLSHYQLTIEPGTVFAAAPPVLPADDIGGDMLARCRERLVERGFAQYEVSAYARAGRACRHNLNYWTFGDYLGVGAGAHGKLTLRERRIVRTTQLARAAPLPGGGSAQRSNAKPVAAADLPFEFMLNALRLVEGFDVSAVRGAHRPGLGWRRAARSSRLLARGTARSEAASAAGRPSSGCDFSTMCWWNSCRKSRMAPRFPRCQQAPERHSGGRRHVVMHRSKAAHRQMSELRAKPVKSLNDNAITH